MSNTNNGGPAFPLPVQEFESDPKNATIIRTTMKQRGMTLRDWFAGQALAAMLSGADSSSPWECVDFTPESIAKKAKASYQHADAMLEARNAQ